MNPSRGRRAIDLALHCYPARWRSRHGDDATQLASALLDEGVPWWSICANFLGCAARERFFRTWGARAGAAVAALAVGVAALPLAVLTSLTPASASSPHVVIVISKPAKAARQLESAFSAHHFRLSVTERVVPARLVGSILSVSTGTTGANDRVISQLRGRCVDGSLGCTNGLILPRHFAGNVHVTLGRAKTWNVRGSSFHH
jgi:hypothetical protein